MSGAYVGWTGHDCQMQNNRIYAYDRHYNALNTNCNSRLLDAVSDFSFVLAGQSRTPALGTSSQHFA